MKYISAAFVLSVAVCWATPAFAQDAQQVAGAVAPMALALAPYGGRDQIDCSSVNHQPARCPVSWREAVLVRQTSRSECVEGRTWGLRRGAIWVDNGCSGVFAAAGRHDERRSDRRHDDDDRGPDRNRSIRMRCASQGYQYNMCQVDIGHGSDVRIERQISDTRCVEGRTWGWNRAGVWVDGGCEAVFRVERRWR